MQKHIKTIESLIESNKIELQKAERIRTEIKENIKYNLFDDWLILL